MPGRSGLRHDVDTTPAAIVALLREQAAALDAAADLREHEADVAVAAGVLQRRLAAVGELAGAVERTGYVVDDVRALLDDRDATALRRAAQRCRELVLFETGQRLRPPVTAA